MDGSPMHVNMKDMSSLINYRIYIENTTLQYALNKELQNQ